MTPPTSTTDASPAPSLKDKLRTLPRVYYFAAALVLLIPLAALFIYLQFIQTYHYGVVDPDVLYRSGFRSLREENNAINASSHRIKHVVAIISDEEYAKHPFCDELEFCHNSRIRYARLAVPLGGWPTVAQLNQFLGICGTEKYRPILVHCAQGVRRTGMFVAAYQMNFLGYSKEQAKAAIQSFGHSDRTVNDIKTFIDAYDPKTVDYLHPLPPPSSDE